MKQSDQIFSREHVGPIIQLLLVLYTTTNKKKRREYFHSHVRKDNIIISCAQLIFYDGPDSTLR
jgi:hypothetical protein